MEEMVSKIKNLINVLREACDAIDASDMGVSNYFPDGKSQEMLLLCLNLFNMFIAISDGKLDDEEVDFINQIADTSFSKKDIRTIIDKTGLRKDSFAEQVPVIFRAFVDADNYAEKAEAEGSLTMMLYQVFSYSGLFNMISNTKIATEEYDRLVAYLNTLYKFIKQNLKYGCSDIRKPVDFLSDILEGVNIEGKDLLGKRKSDSDEEGEESDNGDEESLESLLNELNSMIGLDEVKYEVTSLMNLLRVKMLREEMGLDMPPVSMHLVFSGNPGTGKTTVARLLAKIYKKIGVLSKGQLIEVDRSGLVGGYVGQTAIKVGEVVDSAKGGVLFIDEAYSLTPENTNNDYGSEAIDTLVKAMEDNRKDLIVIVAGYPDLMEHFLSSNPGLRSRFNKFIYFRDYTPDELTQIFISFCNKHGYRASRPVLDYVKSFFEDRCSKVEKNFGNAREVRNLFEYAISRQANRVMMINNPSQDNLTLLKLSDVSGENVDLGKQQYMAQKIMNDLTRERRHGIEKKNLGICMDEMEITAGAEEVMNKNHIKTVEQILDYIDEGKAIKDLTGMNQEYEAEIVKVLKGLGYSED